MNLMMSFGSQLSKNIPEKLLTPKASGAIADVIKTAIHKGGKITDVDLYLTVEMPHSS